MTAHATWHDIDWAAFHHSEDLKLSAIPAELDVLFYGTGRDPLMAGATLSLRLLSTTFLFDTGAAHVLVEFLCTRLTDRDFAYHSIILMHMSQAAQSMARNVMQRAPNLATFRAATAIYHVLIQHRDTLAYWLDHGDARTRQDVAQSLVCLIDHFRDVSILLQERLYREPDAATRACILNLLADATLVHFNQRSFGIRRDESLIAPMRWLSSTIVQDAPHDEPEVFPAALLNATCSIKTLAPATMDILQTHLAAVTAFPETEDNINTTVSYRIMNACKHLAFPCLFRLINNPYIQRPIQVHRIIRDYLIADDVVANGLKLREADEYEGNDAIPVNLRSRPSYRDRGFYLSLIAESDLFWEQETSLLTAVWGLPFDRNKVLAESQRDTRRFFKAGGN